jgi:hypothetical protein
MLAGAWLNGTRTGALATMVQLSSTRISLNRANPLGGTANSNVLVKPGQTLFAAGRDEGSVLA